MEGLNLGSLLGLDNSGFMTGMLQAESVARVFPSIVSSFMANPLLGLADTLRQAAHGIADLVDGTASKLHELGVEAANVGVSVGYLSKMNAAFEAAGAGAGAFGNALEYVQRNAYQAMNGNDQLAKTFARIHISLGDLKSLSAPELFERFKSGLQGLPDQGARIGVSMELAGRSARGMIGQLVDASGGIGQFTKIVEQLGASVPEELEKAAGKVHGLGAIFGIALDGIRNAAARPILQYLAEHSERITGVMVRGSEIIRGAIGSAFGWIESHSSQIGQVFSTIGSVASTAFTFIVDHAKPLGVAIAAVGGVLTGAALAGGLAVIGAVASAIGAPLLSLGGVIGGLIAGFAAFSVSKDAAGAMNFIGAAAKTLWADMQAVWGWIQSTAIPIARTGLTAAIAAVMPIIHTLGAAFTAIAPVIKGVFVSAMAFIRPVVTDVIGAIGYLLPVISQGITTAIKIASPIIGGLGSVFEGLTPWLQIAWGIFSEVASVVGTVLVGAFRGLMPVLQSVGEILGSILNFIGKVIGGLGNVAKVVTNGLGITQGSASDAARSAVDDFTAAGGGADGNSPGTVREKTATAGSGGAGNVTIENLNVASPFDADHASDITARKLKPAFQLAQQQARKQMELAAAKTAVKAGI